MTAESQDLGLNVSSKDKGRCFLKYNNIPVTILGLLGPTKTKGGAPPAGLTNTSSSSNLVSSQEVSHPCTN